MTAPKGARPRHLPRNFTLFIIAVGILSVLAGCSISTPAFKGKPSLHPPFKKAWEFRPSSPDDQFSDHIIKGDTFYYATGHGYGAVDLRTGKAIWEAKFPAEGYPVFLAEEHDTLALSVSNWALIICDPSDGRIRWTTPMPGKASPILIHEKRLFFESPQGEFECMDIETNKIVWSRPIGIPKLPDSCKPDLGYLSGRPLIVGSTVFIGRDYGEILAVDKQTGIIRWRKLVSQDDCSSVVGFASDGQNIFCSLSNGQVCSFDQNTGENQWSFDVGGAIDYCSPALHDNLLIFSNSLGQVFGLNKSDGTFAFRRTLGQWGRSSRPLVESSFLLFIGRSSLEAIDYSGASLWHWNQDQSAALYAFLKPYGSGYLLLDITAVQNRRGSPVAYQLG